MQNTSIYVGLDVSKEHISVGIARAGRLQPEYHGNISHSTAAMRKLAERLSQEGHDLRFCYEAGPFGYGLYRDLTALGYDCVVVAPALIPKKPGDRVKTDRRDSLLLARLHRSGELVGEKPPTPPLLAFRLETIIAPPTFRQATVFAPPGTSQGGIVDASSSDKRTPRCLFGGESAFPANGPLSREVAASDRTSLAREPSRSPEPAAVSRRTRPLVL